MQISYEFLVKLLIAEFIFRSENKLTYNCYHEC